MDPKIDIVEITQNPLTEVQPRNPGGGSHGSEVSSGSSHESITQVTPQHLHLKMRPSESFWFRSYLIHIFCICVLLAKNFQASYFFFLRGYYDHER